MKFAIFKDDKQITSTCSYVSELLMEADKLGIISEENGPIKLKEGYEIKRGSDIL